MKRIIVFIGIGIAAWLCLVSCMEKEKSEERTVTPVRLDYDGRNANRMMLKMWEVFDRKDREAVKELLSAEAIGEIEECDSKIDDLFDFIQGEIVECRKYLLTSSKGRSAGKTQYELEGGYEMITTEETYLFKFRFVAKDDFNEDNLGVYRMDILTKDLSQSYKNWGGNDSDICIYTKEEADRRQ